MPEHSGEVQLGSCCRESEQTNERNQLLKLEVTGGTWLPLARREEGLVAGILYYFKKLLIYIMNNLIL